MNLLDFIFPKYCLSCGKDGQYFCPTCQQTIKRTNQVCPVCEKPSPLGISHPVCKTTTSLDGLSSIYVYEGIIKEAIHKLKYKYVTDLTSELWKITDKEIEKRIDNFQGLKKFVLEERPIIVPIPLYWYKENLRGFNQATIIGNLLKDKYRLNLDEKILRRNKHTQSQTTLKGKERQQNVKGIFSVSPIILNSKFLIHNSSVLLVDDVWTTGSTLKEACKVLKQAGAKKVWGFTIAR